MPRLSPEARRLVLGAIEAEHAVGSEKLATAIELLLEWHDRQGGGLTALRRANATRQGLWCPNPDQQPDMMFRAVELGGEVGEALNVVKKIERERKGWRGSRATVDDLGAELADVVICTDLLAMSAGVDLWPAIVAKFNATSRAVGLPTLLTIESEG